eukprot:TRINITY_DN1755_c2_g1_i1.p1 TRINITY_DN1755_c2_g1~~TRINITY_DN1755_c2_g1_i1.p1  ORF type:complete len:187 (-),score=53.76 TRINITY_DN1755_c2_g1_i1:545-1105(-)
MPNRTSHFICAGISAFASIFFIITLGVTIGLWFVPDLNDHNNFIAADGECVVVRQFLDEGTCSSESCYSDCDDYGCFDSCYTYYYTCYDAYCTVQYKPEDKTDDVIGKLDGPYGVSSYKNAANWLDDYPVGYTFNCWYDPDDERRVSDGRPGYPVTALIFTIIFSVIVGAILLTCVINIIMGLLKR